jgi:hypothetical protein
MERNGERSITVPDENLVRADVESELGREVSDEDFKAISSLLDQAAPRSAQLEEFARLYHVRVDAGLVVPDTVPEPPEYWKQRSKQFLEGFRPSQERALAILNLGEPASVERLPALLKEIRDREPERGDSFQLHFPSPAMFDADSFGYGFRERIGGMSTALKCRRGYHATDLDEYMRQLSGGTPVSHDELERARQDWIAARINRLAQIADLAADITQVSGCSEWEAVGFLLCDRYFDLPWIRATVDILGRLSLSKDAEPWFEVRVFSPKVSPEDVAAAYRAARRRWLGGGSSETMHSLSKQERDEELLAFVAEWEKESPKPSWEERWRRWNSRADLAPSNRFKNAESMRVLHARAQRELGKETSPS